MMRTLTYLVTVLGVFILSGCTTTRDVYLKDEVSGRIYGPLDTSCMTDSHIPAGHYIALYLAPASKTVTRDERTGTRRTALLRLPGATNDIPQSEWNSFERSFLLSPELNDFSEHEPGAVVWGEENGQDWALRLLGTQPDGVVIERLGSKYPRPPSVDCEDIETHRILTQTTINRLEARQAPLTAIVEFLRQQVPKVRHAPAVGILLDVSAKEQPPPITLCLRNVPLMDAIDYVTEVTGCTYTISGNTVRITKRVQPAR